MAVQTQPTGCSGLSGRPVEEVTAEGQGIQTEWQHSDPDIYGLFSSVPNAELHFSELAEVGSGKDFY